MSMTDSDKSGSTRLSPSLNQRDSLGQRMAMSTTSVNPVTEATTRTARVETKNGQVLVHDGADYRILIGVAPDGSVGLWITKSGYDILEQFS